MNLAFAFILKGVENGSFRYFNTHEDNVQRDRSQLTCTKDDLTKLKDFFNKTDAFQLCSRERVNTNCRFYKLKISTVFAALFKVVPMSCKDAVLTKSLLRGCTINSLTFEENTRQPDNDNVCLFLALLSICTEISDWKKKHQKNLFVHK